MCGQAWQSLGVGTIVMARRLTSLHHWRGKVAAGQTVSFLYLEAAVWDADAKDVEDSADLLGIRSHTIFADEIGKSGSDGMWRKTYTNTVGSRAMDTRSRGWGKDQLEMVGGGKVTITYSVGVKFLEQHNE